jgi:hypothetical protein
MEKIPNLEQPSQESSKSVKESPEGIQETRYFSEGDKEVLQAGLSKLQDYLENVPPEKLPSIIAFLDSAARPLFYFLKPLFEKVYKEKGVDIPQYRYVQNFSHLAIWSGDAWEVDMLEYEIEGLQNRYDEEKSEGLKQEIERLSISLERLKIEMELKEHPPTQDRTDFADEEIVFQNRIEEVFDLAPNDEVLFIDDYINKANTVEGLSGAIDHMMYENESSGLEAKLFVLFRNEESLDYEKTHKDSPVEVISGTIGKGYSGFRYRDTSTYNPYKQERYQKEKESIIGVKKVMGDKFVNRAPNANSTRMAELRSLMSKYGKEMLEQDLERKKEDE